MLSYLGHLASRHSFRFILFVLFSLAAMAEYHKAWAKYLCKVDAHAKREEDFMKAVSEVLVKNGFYVKEDLLCAEICKFKGTEALNPGQEAFLRRAVNKAQPAASQPSEAAAPSVPPAESIAKALALFQAQVQAQAKTVPKPGFNLATGIAGLSLAGSSPDTWPAAKLVEELREEVEKGVAKGAAVKPFTYIDIGKRCRPSWAPEPSKHSVDDEEPDGQSECEKGSLGEVAKALSKVTKVQHKELTFHQRVAALHKWALAAAVAGQISYAAAVAHIDICLRVSDQARAGGRHPALGRCYDEAARRRWAQRAEASYPGFSVDVAASSFDKEILAAAEVLYDRRGSAAHPKKPWVPPKRQYWGQGYGNGQPWKRQRY